MIYSDHATVGAQSGTLSGVTQTKAIHPYAVTAFQGEMLGSSKKSLWLPLPDEELKMWFSTGRQCTSDQ